VSSSIFRAGGPKGKKSNLSTVAYDRIIKVSRTIADVAASGDIKTEHLPEAIQFTSLHREDWAM
jgi:magnesium chelatase family protein